MSVVQNFRRGRCNTMSLLREAWRSQERSYKEASLARKVVIISLITILVSLVVYGIVLGDTVRVYNKDWVRTHNIQKHSGNTWTVYNKDWVKQGYIQTDGNTTRLYDTNWSRQQQTDTPNDFGIVVDVD